MNKFLEWLPTTVFATGLLLVGPSANATLLTYSSNSTFSACQDDALCSSSTEVTFLTGSKNGTLDILNAPSTTVSTDGTVDLAGLSFQEGNISGDPNNPLPQGEFNYNLVLSFTDPVIGGQTDTFSLTLKGTAGPGSADTFTISNLDISTLVPPLNPSLSVGSVTLSNFRFEADNTVSTFDLGSATWTIGASSPNQNADGTLELLADVSFLSNIGITPVPEPGSLALLGSGLVFLGIFRRRKKR